MNLSTRMENIWQRGKTKATNLLGVMVSRAHATQESTPPLPYEIVEMITAHLVHDIPALKACSLTCRTLYAVTVPYIHHTLTLGRGIGGKLNPLSELHELGLMGFAKEIRVKQLPDGSWFTPEALSSFNLRHFSAFANVHTLRLQRLEIHRFIPCTGRHFEHLSPSLRSIMLFKPRCTPQQLLYFLSYFPNLDDIEIRQVLHTHGPTYPAPNLPPFSAPKLRGQLTLCDFSWIEIWTRLVTLCGGLRFRYMDLCNVAGCTSVLLDACVETLETLRFNVTDSDTVSK